MMEEGGWDMKEVVEVWGYGLEGEDEKEYVWEFGEMWM